MGNPRRSNEKSQSEEGRRERGDGPIEDHVEDGTKLGALVERTGGLAVGDVEDAGGEVGQGGCFRVEGHHVERDRGRDEANIAYLL